LLLNNGPLDFVSNEKIDVICNENFFISCILGPIPKETSYIITLSCFYIQDETKNIYFKDNLDDGLKMWYGFTYEPYMINIDLDHKLCQLIKLSQKGVLNLHNH
jgi:hypothetical protein